jgi:hypothetical protein
MQMVRTVCKCWVSKAALARWMLLQDSHGFSRKHKVNTPNLILSYCMVSMGHLSNVQSCGFLKNQWAPITITCDHRWVRVAVGASWTQCWVIPCTWLNCCLWLSTQSPPFILPWFSATVTTLPPLSRVFQSCKNKGCSSLSFFPVCRSWTRQFTVMLYLQGMSCCPVLHLRKPKVEKNNFHEFSPQ